jgi:hypothetical protein
MISDAERRRLDEIETLLRLEDPAFVRRFDGRTHTPSSSRTVLRATILAALAIVVVPAGTAVAGALGGPVAAAMAVWVMTSMCVGVVLCRRRAQPPRRWR